MIKKFKKDTYPIHWKDFANPREGYSKNTVVDLIQKIKFKELNCFNKEDFCYLCELNKIEVMFKKNGNTIIGISFRCENFAFKGSDINWDWEKLKQIFD